MQHCIQSFISKKKRGESQRWRRSSAGCERVQALEGEKRAKMLGESDRESKLHDMSRPLKTIKHTFLALVTSVSADSPVTKR